MSPSKQVTKNEISNMPSTVKPIRIETAFDNRERIFAMFGQHAPYRAIAAYAPEGVDETDHKAARPVLPWFRGDWAIGGKPLVHGADLILHNNRFVAAARMAFGTSFVRPEFVVVNVNAPMPAGTIHVDVPSFYGATREEYPLPFLRVMGCSRLFESWRVVRAGVVAWFYDGGGGNFDYWPDGLDGPMLSETPPFGNVALMADNDCMYHRIGAIGDLHDSLPRISDSAQIQPDSSGNWMITENGEVRATYPSQAIRLSLIWKAEVRIGDSSPGSLSLDQIMKIFTSDLRHRNVHFDVPSDPLTDTSWILLLQRVYPDPNDFHEKAALTTPRIA
jgi:hypothetical protein